MNLDIDEVAKVIGRLELELIVTRAKVKALEEAQRKGNPAGLRAVPDADAAREGVPV